MALGLLVCPLNEFWKLAGLEPSDLRWIQVTV
jgi:hypothetical protein